MLADDPANPSSSELVRAAPAEHCREGHEHDPDVADERQILDILALHRETLVERQLAAAVDLHRPGDPRLDLQPEVVLRRIALNEVELIGPRPDARPLPAPYREE